jgi:Putative Actinobacterial Holin-X, holin superfamily III
MATYPGRSQEGGTFERERVAPDSRTNDSSVSDLISGLVNDAQQLVHREIDLAKREVAIELDKVKQGAVALGAGAGLAVIGALLLGHMLVYLVQTLTGLALWVSYLIVGALFAIGGGLLLMQGIKRMKTVDPVPRETIESVKEDIQWIKEQNPSDKI